MGSRPRAEGACPAKPWSAARQGAPGLWREGKRRELTRAAKDQRRTRPTRRAPRAPRELHPTRPARQQARASCCGPPDVLATADGRSRPRGRNKGRGAPRHVGGGETGLGADGGTWRRDRVILGRQTSAPPSRCPEVHSSQPAPAAAQGGRKGRARPERRVRLRHGKVDAAGAPSISAPALGQGRSGCRLAQYAARRARREGRPEAEHPPRRQQVPRRPRQPQAPRGAGSGAAAGRGGGSTR